MTPAAAIAMLDRFLASDGAPATLRRVTWSGGAGTPADLAVQAHVRGYRPDELVSGIAQGDSMVILSPTPLIGGSWPDGLPIRGDHLVIDERVRTIEAVAPIHLAGTLVRIDLQVRG